jgi:hypothetical protein
MRKLRGNLWMERGKEDGWMEMSWKGEIGVNR